MVEAAFSTYSRAVNVVSRAEIRRFPDVAAGCTYLPLSDFPPGTHPSWERPAESARDGLSGRVEGNAGVLSSKEARRARPIRRFLFSFFFLSDAWASPLKHGQTTIYETVILRRSGSGCGRQGRLREKYAKGLVERLGPIMAKTSASPVASQVFLRCGFVFASITCARSQAGWCCGGS